MSEAGERLIAGVTGALAVARGEEPAASVTMNGHTYVPKAAFDRLQAENASLREQVEKAREALPMLHLIGVFVEDMTERNWADKGDYINQQVGRIRALIEHKEGA